MGLEGAERGAEVLVLEGWLADGPGCCCCLVPRRRKQQQQQKQQRRQQQQRRQHLGASSTSEQAAPLSHRPDPPFHPHPHPSPSRRQVVHEVLPLEVLMLLLETPSNDGVEVAVGFVTEVGALLQDLTPGGLNTVFDRFRAILHEGAIDKRTQFIIENLFAIRKAGFDKE